MLFARGTSIAVNTGQGTLAGKIIVAKKMPVRNDR